MGRGVANMIRVDAYFLQMFGEQFHPTIQYKNEQVPDKAKPR